MTARTRTGLARIAIVALVAGLIGIVAPPVSALEEGSHLHVAIANHPAQGVAIARAPYTFRVTLIEHGGTGRITSFRVSDYSTVKKSVSVSLGPCADCSTSFDFTVDFSAWSCGEHELRWTANVPETFEGKRQFTTSRSYVTLAGCTTNRHGRSGWFGGGGSWYEGVDYAIGIQGSPDTAIRPGAVTRWRVQSSANRGCLFLNPRAHDGSIGTPVGPCWSGQSWVTRTIPSTARPGDKLMLYAEGGGGRHAGPSVQLLGDGSVRPTVWLEWQSWWRTAGLVVP